MHLSMHNWMRAEPIDVTIRRLAKYGYESIEISGEPDVFDTKEVRKLLDDNGLKCWGAVTLMLGDRCLPAKDEQKRANSVKYVKDCITMVKELEGQEITIVPRHRRQGGPGRHARGGVAVGRRRAEGDLRPRDEGRRSPGD